MPWHMNCRRIKFIGCQCPCSSHSKAANQLLVQQLIQAINKVNTKLRITGPLFFVRGNPPVTGGFLSQRASNVESDSMPWHHHESIPCDALFCLASVSTTELTHWGRDKIDAISQTTFSCAFSSMKIVAFLLNFHWNMFARVQLTINQHWFR